MKVSESDGKAGTGSSWHPLGERRECRIPLTRGLGCPGSHDGDNACQERDKGTAYAKSSRGDL